MKKSQKNFTFALLEHIQSTQCFHVCIITDSFELAKLRSSCLYVSSNKRCEKKSLFSLENTCARVSFNKVAVMQLSTLFKIRPQDKVFSLKFKRINMLDILKFNDSNTRTTSVGVMLMSLLLTLSKVSSLFCFYKLYT